MEPRDDTADRLADEALLAIMRLLVHQEHGMVTEIVDGEPYDVLSPMIVEQVQKAADGYLELLRQHEAGDGAARLILSHQVEIIRRLLDGQWNVVRMALPALIRETDRRSPPEEPEDETEAPPFGLD